MKKFLIGLAVVVVVVLAVVFVSDSAKPGDLLYSVDRAVEPAQVWFAGLTGGRSAKAQAYLDLAEERLQEIEDLLEAETSALVPLAYAQDAVDNSDEEGNEVTGDPTFDTDDDVSDEVSEDIDELTEDYDEHMDDAVEEAEGAQDEGEEEADEVLEEVTTRSLNNQEVLLRVYDQVPVAAQKGIERALENAEAHQEKAMNKITNQHREEIKADIEMKKQAIADKKEALQMKKDEVLEDDNNGNDNSNRNGNDNDNDSSNGVGNDNDNDQGTSPGNSGNSNGNN